MTEGWRLAAASIGGGLVGGLAVALAGPELGLGATSPAAVRQALASDPAMIPDAMDLMRSNDRSAAVAANAQALRTPFRNAVAGDPDGDVTVVEFFDYACGFCKRSQPAVAALLRDDAKVRVVYRELPILGEPSLTAATASLKAAGTPRYLAFHDALFARDVTAVEAAAKAAGLPPSRLSGQPDAAERAEITRNVSLAQALGVSGTPAWVIGDQVLDGALDEAALKAAVAEARAKG